MADLQNSNFDQSLHKRPSFPDRSYSFSFNSTRDPPKKPFLDRYGSVKKSMVDTKDFTKGMVSRLCKSFESARLNNSSKLDTDTQSSSPLWVLKRKLNARVSSLVGNLIKLPGTEDKIVVFFTSLRGIRRTYEDCCTVKMIFKGFRVPVDERDISMDSAYKKELLSVLGEKTVTLPQVFIRGKHIGGAEEVRQLHEVGELIKLLKGFPFRDPLEICESCGDARFVPCLNCSGSRKVFVEEEEQLQRCMDCNENGLQRCPECNC